MKTDFLVIGSGAAGLSFALKAAAHGHVTIVTKGEMNECNTNYAQGGICSVTYAPDTFEKHIRCGLCRTGIKTSENTGNTHSVFFVTDHQIAFIQLTFNAIQRDKRCAFRHCFHNHLAPFYFVCVKAMKRLPESMHNVICDIHYIINRTQTDDAKFILQPFRTLFNSNPFHSNTCITWTCLTVFYSYLDIQIMIFDSKSIDRRSGQCSLFAILYQISIQVACHPIV